MRGRLKFDRRGVNTMVKAWLPGCVVIQLGEASLDFPRLPLSVKLHKEQLNPFAPGDFAEKRVLKLVVWFSGHCRAIKS